MSVAVEGKEVEKTLTLVGQLEQGLVLLLAGRVVLLLHELELENSDRALSAEDRGPRNGLGLIGESPSLARVRQQILKVADLSVTVLIRGETGTGKELVARSIYENSDRKDLPLVTVNMAAITPSLAASELFGSEKGAFTGAHQRRQGYFQKAGEGTIFLDEIGDAPIEVQVLLLRALETGEIQPVGGRTATAKQVKARILAATDSNLEQAVSDGKFKSPLLHRLSSFEIVLPPLRERREDFGRLFFFFLEKYFRELLAGKAGGPTAFPRVSARLVAKLATFDWPGNVRQLANFVRQLVVESRGLEEIGPSEGEIAALVRQAGVTTACAMPSLGQPSKPALARKRISYRDTDDVNEDELFQAMRSCEWRIGEAASILGVSRPSLYNLIDKSPHLRRATEIRRKEIADKLKSGKTLDELVAGFKVSKRALKLRMRDLGLR